jgi:uncharacterized protein YjbI with pentapeptide repeats
MPKKTRKPGRAKTKERPLRKLSQVELTEILAQHRKWVESEGKQGRGADLRDADLRGANLETTNLQGADLRGADLERAYLAKANLQGALLFKANLQGADLPDADLRGARLEKANLQGAHLYGASLQRAILTGADLRGTELDGAKFREAILQDTKLRKEEEDKVESARGLQAQNLAGANVSLATLPEDIHKFEGLSVVEEASKNARKIFISLLVGCVYSWLTIATTTDARLLTNSSSSPLPIIQTAVPIAGFYWAAPFLLLSMFVYLHLYLQRLWEVLAEMPAVFPDGRPLDKRAYPWLLNGLVRVHFKLLRDNRPLYSHAQFLVSVLLAWWTVPATIGLFWWRYLYRHHWWGTALHIVLLTLAVGLAISFQRSARATLRLEHRESFHQLWKEAEQSRRSVRARSALLFRFLTSSGRLTAGLGLGVLLFSLLAIEIAPFGAKLFEADVSTKPANWTGENTEDEVALVKGAELRGRDLSNARAQYAFLVKARLDGANLRGADLSFADLRFADLQGADLSFADLSFADLQEADLTAAHLQGAVLVEAKLQKADLSGANLRGAHLPAANLQEADLSGAGLWGAYLFVANLQEADLEGAELQGADLRGAVMRFAALSRANLQEADLSGANLQEAVLTAAKLQKADLSDADLRGAVMRFADLREVIGLTQEQLDLACGDAETKLPPGMFIKPCPEESN